MSERNRSDVVVRRALAVGVGLVAVVLGMVLHISVLLGLGAAMIVITAIVSVVGLVQRRTSR